MWSEQLLRSTDTNVRCEWWAVQRVGWSGLPCTLCSASNQLAKMVLCRQVLWCYGTEHCFARPMIPANLRGVWCTIILGWPKRWPAWGREPGGPRGDSGGGWTIICRPSPKRLGLPTHPTTDPTIHTIYEIVQHAKYNKKSTPTQYDSTRHILYLESSKRPF